ncbi:MAG TPA: DUF1385 domain-containing protein [Tissierellaceae bacterium]|nr:DUF1385 domain-containing protein [Tissierellaceae bacterium]
MEIKNSNIKAKHKTTIGGQALIEGVMMRGPKKISMAVRKPDYEIELKVDEINSVTKKYKVLGLPLIRGVVSLIESMLIGTKALMYSANFYEDDIEDQDETWTEKVFKDKSEDVEMGFTVLISILLSVGIFMVLPSFLTSIFKNLVNNHIILNLIEGLIRVSIFFVYVIWISKLDDIKRVFEYHGAEHKSIHCYEHNEELTVENIKKYPILHPRCGTSFLFMVMIISIFVLSFFGWPNPLERVIIRIAMFPVIAGISYEINRIIGKSDSKLSYIISYPGLMVQKLATVREPDEEQIQVAIEALSPVIPEDKGEDLWK